MRYHPAVVAQQGWPPVNVRHEMLGETLEIQLVAELMQALASAFSERERLLQDQWWEGGDAQTEDLRIAWRGYRVSVNQLLMH